MNHVYTVELTEEAFAQLNELFLDTVEHASLDAALAARDAIEEEFAHVGRNPFASPMIDDDPAERKLVIPFGRKTGYVALFSIESGDLILITAVRHQRQEDWRR